MLTTVLDRLTTLTSKYFIISAFIPVMTFAALNGAVWQQVYGGSGRWTNAVTLSGQAAELAVVLIALAIIAYVLWSLSGFLRSVLEGQALWSGTPLAKWSRAVQHQQLTAWRTEYYATLRTGGQIAAADWAGQLEKAAVAGHENHKGVNKYVGDGPAAAALNALVTQREKLAAPAFDALNAAAAAFEQVLSANDVTAKNGRPEPDQFKLDDDRSTLLTIFQYSKELWETLEVEQARRLQLRAGKGTAAPTAFGNVGASMNSYAIVRYGMDLPTFWTRLQPLLSEHKDFYASLQDSKAQVDFLVSCVWLSVVTSAFWLVALPATTLNWRWFLLVAAGGPAITLFLYRAAIESYMAFAELVRTAVDLYRFDLLKALRISRPHRLEQERQIWRNLNGIISFGLDWMDLGYEPERSEKKS